MEALAWRWESPNVRNITAIRPIYAIQGLGFNDSTRIIVDQRKVENKMEAGSEYNMWVRCFL